MNTSVNNTFRDTSEMTAALEGMIRRVRRLIVLRGLSLVILAGLAGMAVAMTVDGVRIIYAPWARWTLALLTYGPAAAAAVWTLLRPLSQTFTPAGLARVIERRHPELHERISSAVELETAASQSESLGSRTLIQALGQAAASDIRNMDPRTEISIRKVARFLVLVGLALTAATGMMLIWPDTIGRLALRSTLPVLNLPNIHAGDLAVEPGDTVMQEGERLRVVLTSSRDRLPDARLLIQRPGERMQSLAMNNLADAEGAVSRFTVVTEPVRGDFRYRIRGGDAVTREYRVTVTPPPQVMHLDIIYRYPDYTGKEPSRMRVVNGDIRAIAGSEVLVRATFNKPMEQIGMRIDGKPVAEDNAQGIQVRHLEPDVAELRIPLTAGMQSRWSLEGQDAFGFRGGTREYPLEAVEDAVPEVRIVSPAVERLRLGLRDRVTLQYSISDDFGIDLARLVMETEGGRLPVRPVPLGGDSRGIKGSMTVSLAELPLQHARTLRLQLRASDRRPASLGGARIGQSKTLHIDLDANAKPYLEQLLDTQTQGLRDALTKARQDIGAAKGGLTALQQGVQRKTGDKAIQEATRKTLAAMEKSDQALALADDVLKGGFYDGLRQTLNDGAGAAILQAADHVAHVPVAEDAAAQSNLVTAATGEIERADAAVAAMMAGMEDQRQALMRALATRELAERQAELAAIAKEKQPGPPAQEPTTNGPAISEPGLLVAKAEIVEELADPAARLQEQQRQLAEDLADVVRQTPEAAVPAALLQREQIDRLREDIETLHKQQQEAAEQSAKEARFKEETKTARIALEEQLEALQEARRDLTLPHMPVSLPEIAKDLEEGRLREAAEKIGKAAAEVERQRLAAEQEQHLEDLAARLRDIREEEKPMPADEASLRSLAERLETLDKEAIKAQPVDAKAAEAQSPSLPLREALANKTDPAKATAEAMERTARLQETLEEAARDARAERLAGRMEALDAERRAIEELADRSTDLARRLEADVEPWADELAGAEAEATSMQADALQRQETLEPEVAAIREDLAQNPLTAPLAAPPLNPTPLTPAEPKEHAPAPAANPGQTANPRQVEQDADEARRQAGDIAEALPKAMEEADTAVQQARDALETAGDEASDDMRREAQWRLEEAEETREKTRQQAEAAAETARRLERVAEALDQTANDLRAAQSELARVEADRQLLDEAEALRQQASRKADAATQEAERLQQAQAQGQQPLAEALAQSTPSVPAAPTPSSAAPPTGPQAPPQDKQDPVMASPPDMPGLQTPPSQQAAPTPSSAAPPTGPQAPPQDKQDPVMASPPDMPGLQTPPSQQAAMQAATPRQELTGDTLIPEAEVIPNIGKDQEGQVEFDLGHANERPPVQPLPEDFDPGTPPPSGLSLPYDKAGAPDIPVPPAPTAPRKETMSGPVPFSDPVSMTEPITELPKIIMPDRFPQTFSGKFNDRPVPPPPPEKSSSLAPAPRLTKSDLDEARKEFAELSAIHIDDAPESSDKGGQATEELPSEILFEPGAQYSKGAPGQSAMPGMELGQLSQAENQDQQSQSPAQPPMPSGGGSGGGNDPNKPPSQSQSPSQPKPSSPPGDPAGKQGESPSGAQGGAQPGGSSPSRQPGSADADRLRALEERLDPKPRSPDALPQRPAGLDASPQEGVAPETVARLQDELGQMGGLASRLLPDARLPALAPASANPPSPMDTAATLGQLGSHAQKLVQAISAAGKQKANPETLPEHQVLVEALDSAGRAALVGDPRTAEEAALRLARAADLARQHVESLGLTVAPAPADRPADDAVPPEDTLRRLGLPVSDWLRLPGELRSEVLQVKPAEGPEEYRGLIRRYFNDMTRETETE